MAKNTNILRDNNNFGADELYDYRNNFKDMITNSVIKRFDPILRSKFERPFYFRRDSKGNSIFLSENFLKEILPKQEAPILVHDFVRDAFLDMSSYFIKGLKTSKLKKTNSPFSSLRPTKAFVSHQKEYGIFLSNLNKDFLTYITNERLERKILNFDSFLNTFIEFLKKQEEKIFTRSKYLETTKVDNFINGLTISLAADDFSDDFKKISTYVNDNNFNFFLESCRRFGFFIDKNAPWVIQYDFNSPAVSSYLEKYNLKDKDDVIERRYYKSYFSDVDILKDFLVTSYVVFYNLEDRVEFVIDVNKCKVPIVKKVNKEKISQKTILQNYSNFYWLKLYFDIRIIEEKLNLSKAKYDNVISNMSAILQNGKIIDRSSDEDKYYDALDFINYFVLESKQKIDLNKILEY